MVIITTTMLLHINSKSSNSCRVSLSHSVHYLKYFSSIFIWLDLILLSVQATSSPYHRSVQDLAAYTSPAAASRLQSQYSLFLNTPGDKHSAKIFITNQNISATSRLQAAAATVKSELPWPTSGPGATDYHSPGDFSHHLDRNYSPHPYANMTPSGKSHHTSAGIYAPWGWGWRAKLFGRILDELRKL